MSRRIAPRRIAIRIDELVLDGFAPGDRYRIGDAIERELTRLFTEHDASAALAARTPTDAIDGGAFALPHDAGAAAIGAHVARAIHRELAR